MFAKHHSSPRAGFNFTGKSQTLQQNYRNTQEILRAARRLTEEYEPRADEQFEKVRPDLSQYSGGRPIAMRCEHVTHPSFVMDRIVQKV